MLKLFTLAETTETATKPWYEQLLQNVINWCLTDGVKLLIGIVLLFIIFAIINGIAKGIRKSMLKHNRDKTITSVVYQVIRKGLKIVVFIAFLAYVGIETAGIGTIIASLGVGIGLALQGSLANFAGGVIILVMRPFKIGDYIEAQGQSGTVEDIHIFYTYVTTVDNKVTMIPNGVLANGIIINYSVKDLRRVDMNFNISCESNVSLAMSLIEEVINKMNEVIKEPKPFVKIAKQTNNEVEIVTRSWVKNSDYWTVYFNLIEQVKTKFDENNIIVPYQQIDVHIKDSK